MEWLLPGRGIFGIKQGYTASAGLSALGFAHCKPIGVTPLHQNFPDVEKSNSLFS